MDKLFLDLKEVARLLELSQRQVYGVIREMNKGLGDKGFLTLRGRINKQYFMEQIYKSEEGSNASI